MKSYFFNAEPTTDLSTHPSGYDREYDADDYAAFFTPFFSDAGVMAGTDTDACKVVVVNRSTLRVCAGAVYVKGRMARFDGTETITATANCKVVARMNKTADVRSFQLITVPTLTQTEDVYDLELASVTTKAVPGGYEAQVTDTRTFLAYMGQPAYYPPDSDNLPYVLWSYALGFPLTAEQRHMVESNPSLMGVFNASLGAAKAVSVAFTAAEWKNGSLTIPQNRHGRQSDKFSYTLRHRRSDGYLSGSTWAALMTTVGYDAASGNVTLKCEDPFDGEIVFVGAAVGAGSVDMLTVNSAVDVAIREIEAAARLVDEAAQRADASKTTAGTHAGAAKVSEGRARAEADRAAAEADRAALEKARAAAEADRSTGQAGRSETEADRAEAAANRAQAEAESVTVPAAVGVYNVILTDRVTNRRYALIVESGVLKLLGVADTLDATEMLLVDSGSGVAYGLIVEDGTLKLQEG